MAQLRAFLDTAAHHRLGAFFHVAAYTGARRGELLNLRWPDVDLDAKRITITGSTAVIAGERIDGTTKSGRTRVVSIDDGTVAVLRQHKSRPGRRPAQGGRLLARRQGRVRVHHGLGRSHLPGHRDIADDQAHPRSQRAGAGTAAPRTSYRTLGYTTSDTVHATTLLLSGVPVHVVAARLGHADPAITLRVYAHVIRTAEAAAADIFAEAIKAGWCAGLM